MKAALFSSVPYLGPAARGTWPVPVQTYSSDVAQQSVATSLDQFQLADEVGFDWVTVAEHHYAPMSLTPCASSVRDTPITIASAMALLIDTTDFFGLRPM